jgi:hypothetical protein
MMLFSRTTLVWALALSFLTVSSFTLLLNSQPAPSSWLIYVLSPGFIVSVLITGAHGGTKFQEAVAPVADFLVNTFVYALLYSMLLRVLRHLKKQQEAPPRT